ncbi:TrbI/VirB10 family protein [Pseudomonas fluorescens]
MQTNDQAPTFENSTEDADAATAQSSQARGQFDLGKKSKGGNQAKLKLILSIAAVVVVFLVIVVGVWIMVYRQMKSGTVDVDEATAKPDATLAVDKGSDDGMKKAQAEQLRKNAEADAARKAQEEQDRLTAERNSTPPGGKSTAGTAGNGGVTSTGSGNEKSFTPAMRKMNASLVVTPTVQDVTKYGAAGSTEKSSVSGESPHRQSYGQDSGGLDGSSDGSSRNKASLSHLSGTTFASSKAYLAPSGKYLISHATYTRCALYTEIVTTHPGLVDCRLTDPLYSADGSTVIADAGDKLTGEQTVSVMAGETSVFTAWNMLETQSGTRVRIDSLGAGPMGASGTEAWIDHHWKQKFQGAVMLSLFQDGMQALVNTTQKTGGSGYTVNNSEQNVESMASKVLDSSINVADTGHVMAGTVINVIIARDIDFSTVYENR